MKGVIDCRGGGGGSFLCEGQMGAKMKTSWPQNIENVQIFFICGLHLLVVLLMELILL